MRKGFRSAKSYHAKTPEAKARQIAGLTHEGRKSRKGILNKSTVIKNKAISLQSANIIEFATGKEFLNLSFEERPAQECVLRSFYGLPIPEHLIEVSKQITGITHGSTDTIEGVWILGARSGKSFLASIIALYEATRDKWSQYLRSGETGYVIIIATRIEQARQIIQRNAKQMIMDSNLGHLLVKEPIATEIEFKNGMKIISMPCNSTAGRGLPIACFILDEVGHFYGEGYVSADVDIFNALRPRMAQFPGARTLMISTPAAKQGLLYDWYEEGFEVPERLTVHASTEVMNPTIPAKFLEKEKLRDPDNYDREFLALFAEKKSTYFPLDALNAAFSVVGDIEHDPKFKYFAGIDQSGLAGKDRFGFAIAYKEDKTIKVACTRSWETKDGDIITADIKVLYEKYHAKDCCIDRYAGGWVQQALEKIGLHVDIRDTLPQIYSQFKSLLLQGRIVLPEKKELKQGLINTTAYYGRNNSLSIAHDRTIHGHGDLADAVVTAVALADKKKEIRKGRMTC